MTWAATAAMAAALFSRRGRSGWLGELDDIRSEALADPGGELAEAVGNVVPVPEVGVDTSPLVVLEAPLPPAGGLPAVDTPLYVPDEPVSDWGGAGAEPVVEQVAAPVVDLSTLPPPPPPPSAELPPPPPASPLDPAYGTAVRVAAPPLARPAPHPTRPYEMWHPAVVFTAAVAEPTGALADTSERREHQAGVTHARFRFGRLRAVLPLPGGPVDAEPVTAAEDVATDPGPSLIEELLAPYGVPAEPEASTEPEVQPEPEPEAQLAPEPEAEPELEAQLAPEPEPESQPEPEALAEPEADPEPEAEPEPLARVAPEPEETNEPEVQPEPGPDAHVESEPLAHVAPESEAEPEAEAEPEPVAHVAPEAEPEAVEPPSAPLVPVDTPVGTGTLIQGPVVRRNRRIGRADRRQRTAVAPDGAIAAEPTVPETALPELPPPPPPVSQVQTAEGHGLLEFPGGHLRLAEGATTTVHPDVHRIDVELTTGWCWSALGGAAASAAVSMPAGLLTVLAGATALASVEPDGTCFVVVVAGEAMLVHPGGRLHLAPGTMALIPLGAEPVVDQASETEIQTDPLVSLNRNLDDER